ncbi:cysteine--tRNA ligase [Fodinicola feengrottensis]|uniref:cysteine--tRNA ligase n=1 Tax=Fodinicola feengrottensis TaxID=435914 RepID=UPI0031DB2F78
MSLRLYDSLSRSVRDFTPVTPGQVGMYLCGMTVDAVPHIGHLRGGLNFDVLLRWLRHSGYEVTYVRNVTDIDDKILRRAADAGEQWWARAARIERVLTASYQLLGCLPPTVEPRATGHIPEMVEMMRRLIAAGHAYAADGDVYFDVASWPAYGELSGQQVDAMQQGETLATGKRSAVDFTLWKGTKPGEPATASWASPWGPGRPGWHLECSAMAGKYLGPAFDIHGGGIDLVFPHHENEIAQSRADGQQFSAFWLHNAWVTLAGEKMSKSLGNVLSLDAVTQIARPIEVRYYLSTPHYRSTIAYSEEALAEAVTAYRRIEDFVVRASEKVGEVPAVDLPEAFVAAMDDDLGVPRAVAVVHDTIREGNTALQSEDLPAVRAALGNVRAMLGILGLDSSAPEWAGGASADQSGDRLREVVDALVAGILTARQDARNRKDFATADALRDNLKAAGVQVEDGAAGSRWTLER